MTTSTSNRRWYHLTPDRFFIGLLAMQVLLFLSDQFKWFPFNGHKGWTVLIALGVVCLAVLVMLVWGLVCLILRRGFQFGVRSLLLFVVAVSVSLGWFAWEMRQAKRQREAVEVIVRMGGRLYYDYQPEPTLANLFEPRPKTPPQPTTPAWLRKLLGDDFFCDVVRVNCQYREYGGPQRLRRGTDPGWGVDRIVGLLKNEPMNIPDLHGGRSVEVSEAEVFDYIRVFRDGRQEGNETGKIIEQQADSENRE